MPVVQLQEVFVELELSDYLDNRIKTVHDDNIFTFSGYKTPISRFGGPISARSHNVDKLKLFCVDYDFILKLNVVSVS